MGFNFRKSFSIGKFLRINVSKSGIGWSIGRKGVRYTHSATGNKRTTLSLPGTGLSYTIPMGKKKKSKSSKAKTAKNKAGSIKEATAPQPVAQNTATAEPYSYCPTAGTGDINTTTFHAGGESVDNYFPVASADSYTPPVTEDSTAAPDSTLTDSVEAQQALAATVFFSATGKCYHYTVTCCGHSYTRSSTEADAIRMGKVACSNCASKLS